MRLIMVAAFTILMAWPRPTPTPEPPPTWSVSLGGGPLTTSAVQYVVNPGTVTMRATVANRTNLSAEVTATLKVYAGGSWADGTVETPMPLTIPAYGTATITGYLPVADPYGHWMPDLHLSVVSFGLPAIRVP